MEWAALAGLQEEAQGQSRQEMIMLQFEHILLIEDVELIFE